MAIEQQKDNFYVYNNLSLSYIQLGNFSEARKYINEALSLNPTVPYVYNNAGIIYENLGQYKEAIDYYQKALEIDSNYKKAEVNLARVKDKMPEEE